MADRPVWVSLLAETKYMILKIIVELIIAMTKPEKMLETENIDSGMNE